MSFLVAVEPFPVLLEFLTSSSDGFYSSCIVFASLQSYASLLLLLVFLWLFRSWFLFMRLLLLLQCRVVAPPLFCTLRLLYPLILCFVCSNSFCIRSSFFLMLWFPVLLPAFLCVFPHAAAAASLTCLPPCFSTCCGFVCSLQSFSTFSTCSVSGCFLDFCCGSCSSLLRVLWGRFLRVLSCTSLLSALSYVRTFTGFFHFSSVCFLRQLALHLCLLLLVLCLRFSSLRLRFILSGHTLLSFECRSYFLWCFCLVRISSSLSDVVSLWDESGFAEASLSLSS